MADDREMSWHAAMNKQENAQLDARLIKRISWLKARLHEQEISMKEQEADIKEHEEMIKRMKANHTDTSALLKKLQCSIDELELQCTIEELESLAAS